MLTAESDTIFLNDKKRSTKQQPSDSDHGNTSSEEEYIPAGYPKGKRKKRSLKASKKNMNILKSQHDKPSMKDYRSNCGITSWTINVPVPVMITPLNQIDLSPLNLYKEDVQDKVFAAIIKTFLMIGNNPSGPRDLAAFILTHSLATLGGKTPPATVSSRISLHYTRCSEKNRNPILGRIPIYSNSSKRLGVDKPKKHLYYIDSPNIPMGKIPEGMVSNTTSSTSGSEVVEQKTKSTVLKKAKLDKDLNDPILPMVDYSSLDFALLYPNSLFPSDEATLSGTERSLNTCDLSTTAFPADISPNESIISKDTLLDPPPFPLPLDPTATEIALPSLDQESACTFVGKEALDNTAIDVLPLPPTPSFLAEAQESEEILDSGMSMSMLMGAFDGHDLHLN